MKIYNNINTPISIVNTKWSDPYITISDDSYIIHDNLYFGFRYNSGFITEAKIVSLLYVLLRYTYSDYPFGAFKFFLTVIWH